MHLSLSGLQGVRQLSDTLIYNPEPDPSRSDKRLEMVRRDVCWSWWEWPLLRGPPGVQVVKYISCYNNNCAPNRGPFYDSEGSKWITIHLIKCRICISSVWIFLLTLYVKIIKCKKKGGVLKYLNWNRTWDSDKSSFAKNNNFTYTYTLFWWNSILPQFSWWNIILIS